MSLKIITNWYVNYTEQERSKAATSSCIKTVLYCMLAGYCLPYDYRCNMGLCLRGDVYCNGTAECPDGSDEPPNCRSEFCLVL